MDWGRSLNSAVLIPIFCTQAKFPFPSLEKSSLLKAYRTKFLVLVSSYQIVSIILMDLPQTVLDLRAINPSSTQVVLI